MTDILIRNDEDLYSLLERILEGESVDADMIRFEKYPKYEITLRGEDFDGGIPARMMPALTKLQNSIRHIYKELKYDGKKALTKEDKKTTEIIFYADNCKSSYFRAEQFDKILNQLLSLSIQKMTGKQLVITILSLALLYRGPETLKIYLDYKLDRQELFTQITLSEEETKRQKILITAMNQCHESVIKHFNTQETNTAIAKNLENHDKIVLDNNEFMDSIALTDAIKEIAKKQEREEKKVEKRIEGNFRILSVDSGNISNGFKIKVEEIFENRKTFTVTVREGDSLKKQIEILKESEWRKEPLYLHILVVESNKKIHEAYLIEASWKKWVPIGNK